MKLTKYLGLAVLSVLLLGACAGRGGPPALVSEVASNPVYYTQVGMWSSERRNEIQATNYAVDHRIPPNTRVTVERVTSEAVVFLREDTNERMTLVNTQYTGENIEGLFARTFAREQVDLGRFNPEFRDAIERGEVVVGMSRDEVLVARGYPPVHETPSLDNDRWRFWRHRFATNNVHFGADGRVERIE
jgi:hypothetical protein